MTIYRFYRRDSEGDQLIGILPERRKDPKERITEASVIQWVRSIVADIDLSNIYFISVEYEN